MAFQKSNHIFIGKAMKSTEKEFAITRDMGNHLIHRAVIGDIAAPFPRNHELPASPFHSLQDSYVGSPLGCRDCRQKSRRPAANDNDLIHDASPASSNARLHHLSIRDRLLF